jgi:hypothetical protein
MVYAKTVIGYNWPLTVVKIPLTVFATVNGPEFIVDGFCEPLTVTMILLTVSFATVNGEL